MTECRASACFLGFNRNPVGSSSHSMTLTLHWHDGRSPQDWTRLQSAQLSSEALQCVVTTKRC
jgi:hypothetical protein